MRKVAGIVRINIFRTPEISQTCSSPGKTYSRKQPNLRVTGFVRPLAPTPELMWLRLVPRASDYKLPWRQSPHRSHRAQTTQGGPEANTTDRVLPS